MKKITFPKKLSYITSYKPLHWVTVYLGPPHYVELEGFYLPCFRQALLPMVMDVDFCLLWRNELNQMFIILKEACIKTPKSDVLCI